MPPGLLTAVYEVMAVPPLSAGAVNATVAVVDPVAVAVPTVGVLGADIGDVVIELLAELLELLPAILVAYTVNVYAVLADNPVTVIVPDPAWLSVPVTPPGLLTAV